MSPIFRPVPSSTRAHLVGAATFALGLCFAGNLHAQHVAVDATQPTNQALACLSPLYLGGTIPVQGNPSGCAMSDLDADGILDIATATQDDSVAVLWGVGDGTFAPELHIPLGIDATHVEVADVDLDGFVDVIVCARLHGIEVLMNQGSRTFAAPIGYAPGTGHGFVIGKLDQDAYPDIAIVDDTTVTASRLTILVNQGDGTFGAPVEYAASDAQWIAIGDLDGDGTDDLALGHGGLNFVSVYLNQGDATMSPAVVYPTGASSGPRGIEIQDFDGDGDNDLAAALMAAHKVALFVNAGNGTLSNALLYAGSSYPVDLDASDLDQDGDVDLAVLVDSNQSGLCVLFNQGNASFAAPVEYAQLSGQAVVPGDVDLDGDDDLVITSPELMVRLNQGDGSFPVPPKFATGQYPEELAVGDVDLDGDLDIATANEVGDTVSVLLNQGNGQFATHVQYATGDRPMHVEFGDLDLDGDADLLAANANAGSISVLMNQGDGTFATHVTYPCGATPFAFALADLDGDGDLDLAVPNPPPHTLSVLLNAGNGSFGAPSTYATSGTANCAQAGDIDQDGDIDVVIGSQGSTMDVFFNQGNGVFDAAFPIGGGSAAQFSLRLGDLDQDGDLDIVRLAWGFNANLIYTNPGNGFFALTGQYPVMSFTKKLDLGDVDQDGDLDIATTAQDPPNLGVQLNNGDGTFAPMLPFYTLGDTSSCAIADFDQDGANDIAIVNQAEDNVELFFNLSPCGNGAVSSFCFGDGSLATACPCASFGSPGHGCGNSVHTGGARLVASGSSIPDTIQLTLTDVPPGTGTIFLQGNATIANGVVFGDGVRCAGGALIRMGLKIDTDLDGSTTFGPGTGDLQISVAGAVVPGNTYAYQTYYRNPNPSWCPPATFNISNGIEIEWQ